MSKFTLLFFVTLGYYQYFWFYKNWKAIELEQGRPLFPVLRSLLSPFFVLSLFRHIERRRSEKQVERSWRPEFLAWFYIMTLAIDFVVQGQILIHQGSYLLYWVAGAICVALNFYVLYQAQLICNRVENDPFGEQNKQITTTNKIWLVLGAYTWIKVLFGAYLVATGQVDPYSEWLPDVQRTESTLEKSPVVDPLNSI